MIWEDKGFLISKHKYNENSVIAQFYTYKYGKFPGIIYGATSKKLKNYLQIGNKFHLNFLNKNNSKLGYFKIEIDKVTTPIFYEEKKKIFCIKYTLDLIKLLTVENQQNIKIFHLIDNLFNILLLKNWLKDYIYWELEFFKSIGYDINFENYSLSENLNGEKTYFVNSTVGKRIIPSFLIEKTNEPKDTLELISALNLVGDFLEKSILKPNNINFPNTRSEFIKYFKS